MPTTKDAPTGPKPDVAPRVDRTLERRRTEDAIRLSEAVSELIRVVQFRDRDRACCYGLSPSQCYALKGVVDAERLTVNDLAAQLYLDKSTASRIANALIDKGLLAKSRDTEDGRVFHLTATSDGRALHRRIDEDLVREYAELLGDYEPEMGTAITGLVARLARSFSDRTETSGGSCCVLK
jgi:MarR family transcriptional regulator, 2-MHQ and catechol-resistance regulon repressor